MEIFTRDTAIEWDKKNRILHDQILGWMSPIDPSHEVRRMQDTLCNECHECPSYHTQHNPASYPFSLIENTYMAKCFCYPLTHRGRVTHICVGNLTIIGSDNGLSPGRHQAIIRTNAGISLIGLLGTNFSEILIKIKTFSFKKMRSKVSSGKRRPSCLGLNVLILLYIRIHMQTEVEPMLCKKHRYCKFNAHSLAA